MGAILSIFRSKHKPALQHIGVGSSAHHFYDEDKPGSGSEYFGGKRTKNSKNKSKKGSKKSKSKTKRH